ncbi:murein L,D-transpeptidase [Daejeonella sp.]|uniref:L,D-transpeptidase family protein n=1 Tax=Daejeonella sp. TaxID=2805397 RepID=UPI00272F175E|nr:L,D-transpeptidase family protein [Daejeonella sp.]MDP2413713.1 L,D-transpeptidase family protein [Daejeonella sp.]
MSPNNNQTLKPDMYKNTKQNSNTHHYFRTSIRSLKKYLLVLTGISLIGLASACGDKKKQERQVAGKPQPTLDSMSYINYMNNDPLLKEHTDWAKKFYRERNFKLGWFKNNEIVPQAKDMLNMISKAGEEGLNPKKYQFIDFNTLFANLESAKRDSAKFTAIQKEIDVALSSTYFVWASDYYRGVIIPRDNEEIEWDIKRNKIKLHKALMAVLKERESKYSYASFSPLHPDYARLKSALAAYRKIQAAGGWPSVTPSPKLKEGQKAPVVAALKKRLNLSSIDSTFDAETVNALKKFQSDQGMKPDGALDPETAKLLNVPVDQRIKQIILNMERWRWIPKSFEEDYLIVNIPEYRLRVYEKGKEQIAMNVIVGKTMNSTPIFSDKMENVVLAPYWNVPASIVREELGPKIASDPGYLDRSNMELIDAKGNRVSPSQVNWSSVTRDNWKYTLRKKPGPKNDLGDVKFIFPNTNDIYLHDTPHDELFSQIKRNFSHGCVRVERPLELAEYLLRPVGWDMNKIQSTIAQGQEKYVKLKQVLPVYLVYFTAWADESGNVHFREDIYGHDKTLAQQYFNEVSAAVVKPTVKRDL